MLTDSNLRSAVDVLWDKLWSGGLSNLLDAIEQLRSDRGNRNLLKILYIYNIWFIDQRKYTSWEEKDQAQHQAIVRPAGRRRPNRP